MCVLFSSLQHGQPPWGECLMGLRGDPGMPAQFGLDRGSDRQPCVVANLLYFNAFPGFRFS